VHHSYEEQPRTGALTVAAKSSREYSELREGCLSLPSQQHRWRQEVHHSYEEQPRTGALTVAVKSSREYSELREGCLSLPSSTDGGRRCIIHMKSSLGLGLSPWRQSRRGSTAS
jgi:peptide deformylase